MLAHTCGTSRLATRRWKVLEEFAAEDRAAFLHFVTSCSRPPLLGFEILNPRFCVHRVPLPEGTNDVPLPTASTCMSLLKLPDYGDEQMLKSKLLMAVHSRSGFELS